MREFQTRYPAVPGVAVFLALVLSETGQPDQARDVLAPLAPDFELPFDATWLAFTTFAAEVTRGVGDVEWAETLYGLLHPHAELFSVIGGVTTGCTAHYLGVLATMMRRFRDAEEHFTLAADSHERVGAPAHLGRTGVEWARLRLTRRAPGDVEEAKRLLDEALSAATELHLVSVERRARALLETMP
jgi:hypothetical protein